jgi:hypothetical protein
VIDDWEGETPISHMFKMASSSGKWTGLTGTHWLASVVGGGVLAVFARLVMTWLLTK